MTVFLVGGAREVLDDHVPSPIDSSIIIYGLCRDVSLTTTLTLAAWQKGESENNNTDKTLSANAQVILLDGSLIIPNHCCCSSRVRHHHFSSVH